jgi:hypothetical protein
MIEEQRRTVAALSPRTRSSTGGVAADEEAGALDPLLEPAAVKVISQEQDEVRVRSELGQSWSRVRVTCSKRRR